MTTHDYAFLGVAVVLFASCAAFGFRIQWLLWTNRAASDFSILSGWAVWRRVISGNSDGLDPKGGTEFVRLRRGFLVSMVVLIAVIVAMALPDP